MEFVLSCWHFYELNNIMSFGYSSPSLLCWEHCSIPAKEQERPKPAKCHHSHRSTQTSQGPPQSSASLSVLDGTMKSQGPCYPDLVNGGREGFDQQMLKQDTGKEAVLKVDIVACLVKTEPSSVGANKLVWTSYPPMVARS